MPKRYFVTGIGTDVGKTLISAILVEKLQADYWKPIQAGNLSFTDSDYVQSLVSNDSTFFPETYRLKLPMSPHAAANAENISINLENINLPQTKNHLVIEGAGGILVPINKTETILDVIKKLDVEVVLVSRNYLGSINHTLLSYEILKAYNLKIKGIVFNGKSNPETEKIILSKTQLPLLLKVDQENEINQIVVKKYAEKLQL